MINQKSSMSKIVSCVNLKGGVGKTAIAVNFAAYCGRKKLKTLLVDLDAQTNATFCCMTVDSWKKHAATKGTIANLLGARSHTNADGSERNVKTVMKKKAFRNVDLIPSHLDLITLDLDISSAVARESKLKKALKPIIDDYDIIVCDCPPNLTIATQNALACSTHYVVPVSPDFLSGIGVGLLLSRAGILCDDLDHELEHSGIIVSRRGRPAYHRDEVITTLRKTFKGLVFENELKERVSVSKAASQNNPIYDTGDAKAIAEFTAMSEELFDRIGVTI